MPKGVYTRKSLADRFWEKVDKEGPVPQHRPELGPCWVWLGNKGNGYGQLWIEARKRNLPAHRLVHELAGEPAPEDLMVLHRCDNRACVRRDHHWFGTHQENMADRNEKGRQAKGEGHALSKGSDADIAEIRRLWATKHYRQYELARMFDRSQVSISQIVLGKFRTK